jgi:hypothetical protein
VNVDTLDIRSEQFESAEVLRATYKEFGYEKIEEPYTATTYLRMRVQNLVGMNLRILRDSMVELRGRDRSYTPSIEVIDERSEDNGHKGKRLLELAKVEHARQTPRSTHRASAARRKATTYPQHYIERCRVPP